MKFPGGGFALEELVTVGNGRYELAPPFDHVRVGDHVTMYVFRLHDVIFEVRTVTEDD